MLIQLSSPHSGKGKRRSTRTQRGIALFTTLLLLSLLSLLGLAMMLSVNSDMMINGYYGNYRGSFYAADSGMTVARQALLNQIQADVNMTPCKGWGATAGTGCTTDPLSGFNGNTVIAALKTTYGSFSAENSSGSWPGSFAVADNGSRCTNTVVQAPGSPIPHASLADPSVNDKYTYNFKYTLCSTGRAQSLQQVFIKETGNLSLTVEADSDTTKQVQASFSSFGVFIDHFSACSAGLVPGTITGPAFTNGSWNWGAGGQYVYTDPVGQAGAQASYIFNTRWGTTCKQSANSSYTYGSQTISPTFQQGFNPGQPAAQPPANDFSQQWAVLDGKGCGEAGSTCGVSAPSSNPSNSDLAAALSDGNGIAYGSSGAGNVFLPYCTSGPTCTTPNTITGGGIYVNGNANVTLSIGNDASSNPVQIYTIGSGGTTTTVTTNIAANTTTLQVGTGAPVVLTGVPHNNLGVTPQPGTLLYVNGTINSLSGPGQGQPGIQDGAQITVAAASTINITGDLIYAHEPVTLNTSDTLQPANDHNQVLGIFTAGGNINLSSSYSNGNLETDASLAAINSACTTSSPSSRCGFSTSGSGHRSCGGAQICTWTIVGGRIESNAHGVSIAQGNTYFDRRFTSKAGFAPPWFPSTTLPAIDITTANPPKVEPGKPQRLSWVSYPQ